MKKRIITGGIILLVEALFIASRYFTPYAMDLLIGLIAIVGCVEVARVLEKKRMFTSIAFIGSFPPIVYIAMQIGIMNDREWIHYLLYFIIIILALFLINFLSTIIAKEATEKQKDRYGVFASNQTFAFQKSMNSTFVMVYPLILFCSLFVINHFFYFAFVDATGLGNTNILVVFFLTFTFVVTMMTDTFALITGMLIGGPKLAPKISPKKTISGAVGGFVFGSASSMLVYFLFSLNSVFSEAMNLLGLNIWTFLIIGMICAIITQCGDLIASLLKRSARVKDYGTLFPGHGGVMDRVDGLIFSSFVVLVSMFILI
ncbi:MAG: hypothetical protein E7354_01295 [Clostridiales bacterium]|nr:hypothetical protein [Clostridiales bacterium]